MHDTPMYITKNAIYSLYRTASLKLLEITKKISLGTKQSRHATVYT